MGKFIAAAVLAAILFCASAPVFPQDTGGAAGSADSGSAGGSADLHSAGSDVHAKTRYSVDDFGIVSVVDSWSGLPEESGVYEYVSESRELGRIPVRIKDHRFCISFATRSYLIEDEEDPSIVYFRSPTFIHESGSISADITLVLSGRLSFVEAVSGAPQPTSVEGQTLTWNLPQANGATILCKFKRNKPFLVPGEGGPQFDPAGMPRLSQEDIPANADQVLRELETIILVAEREGRTDDDFIKLLRKDLAKLYYLFFIYGLVTDYVPAEAEEGG